MAEQVELIESTDRYVICSEVFTVEALQLDHAFTLRMRSFTDQRLEIRLEGCFDYQREGNLSRLSAEDPSTLAAVGSVLHTDVSSITIWKNGKLEIALANAGLIISEPDEDYEAWGLAATDELKIVCMPGGDLAVWR